MAECFEEAVARFGRMVVLKAGAPFLEAGAVLKSKIGVDQLLIGEKRRAGRVRRDEFARTQRG